MFSGEVFRKKNKLIEENKELISDYKQRIYSNNLVIDSLIFELKNVKKTDTVIKIKYKQRIDSVYVYNYSDYISFYDTLLHTNLLKTDTFICFDSISVQKLTTKILHLQQDSELLANCYIQNNLYSNIINIQDSVIMLKDSVNASLEAMYKQKVKKVKKQRNVATGIAFTEFLILIGVLAK
jgi:hypothetical protein